MKIKHLLHMGLASLMTFSCVNQEELNGDLAPKLTSQDFIVAKHEAMRTALTEGNVKLSLGFSNRDADHIVYNYNGTCQAPDETKLLEGNKVLRVKVPVKENGDVNKKVWLAFNATLEGNTAKVEPRIYFEDEISNLNLPMTTTVKTYQEIFNAGEAQHRQLTMRGALLQFKLTNGFSEDVVLQSLTIKNSGAKALAFKGHFSTTTARATTVENELPSFTAQEQREDITHSPNVRIPAHQSVNLYLWGMPTHQENGQLVLSYKVQKLGSMAYKSNEFTIPQSFFASLQESQFKKLEHSIQEGANLSIDEDVYYYVQFLKGGLVLQAPTAEGPVTLQKRNNSEDKQLWKIVGANTNDFELVNKSTNKALYFDTSDKKTDDRNNPKKGAIVKVRTFDSNQENTKGHLKLVASSLPNVGKFRELGANNTTDGNSVMTMNQWGGSTPNNNGAAHPSDAGNLILLVPSNQSFNDAVASSGYKVAPEFGKNYLIYTNQRKQDFLTDNGQDKLIAGELSPKSIWTLTGNDLNDFELINKSTKRHLSIEGSSFNGNVKGSNTSAHLMLYYKPSLDKCEFEITTKTLSAVRNNNTSTINMGVAINRKRGTANDYTTYDFGDSGNALYFVPADSLPDPSYNGYYYIRFSGNTNFSIQDMGDNQNLRMKANDTASDNQKWRFVSNNGNDPYSDFELVNKQTRQHIKYVSNRFKAVPAGQKGNLKLYCLGVKSNGSPRIMICESSVTNPRTATGNSVSMNSIGGIRDNNEIGKWSKDDGNSPIVFVKAE